MKANLLILVFLLFQLTALAQKTDSATTSPNIIITTTTNSKSDYFSDRKKEFKNAIKLNPLLIFSGDLPVYYERHLTGGLTTEIGLGVTIQNYGSSLLKGLSEDEFQDRTIDYSTGVSAHLGLKYYPNSKGFPVDGTYFAAEWRHRKYHSSITGFKDENFQLENSLQRKEDITEFRLLFGGTERYENNIFWEFYAGPGIRKRTKTDWTPDVRINNNGQNLYTVKADNSVKMLPMLAAGLKVGFAF